MGVSVGVVYPGFFLFWKVGNYDVARPVKIGEL